MKTHPSSPHDLPFFTHTPDVVGSDGGAGVNVVVLLLVVGALVVVV